MERADDPKSGFKTTCVANTSTLIVAYGLGIYLLNLFLAFLTPKFDPSNDALDNEMEGGTASSLPTKQDEEFRPFIRRLPEFKFWHSATRAVAISFVSSFVPFFDVPVFWPVLVMYWIILFVLTSRLRLSFSSRSGIPTYRSSMLINPAVRKQIQHMIKYRYVPFSFGKARYGAKNSS